MRCPTIPKKIKDWTSFWKNLTIHLKNIKDRSWFPRDFSHPLPFKIFLSVACRSIFMSSAADGYQDTGKVVYRNWELVAKGTRITQDFAAFLKGISGQPGT